LCSVAMPSTVGGRSLTPVTSFWTLARRSPAAAGAAVGALAAGAVVGAGLATAGAVVAAGAGAEVGTGAGGALVGPAAGAGLWHSARRGSAARLMPQRRRR